MSAKCGHGYSWFRCRECPLACGHRAGLWRSAGCLQCKHEHIAWIEREPVVLVSR